MSDTSRTPDRSQIPSFQGEELREVIYSEDGHTRAFITERKDGAIRLRLESWMYWDYAGKEEWFWKSTNQSAHVFDSIVRAKELAMARFQNGALEEKA